MKYPVFIDGEIPLNELQRVFNNAGYHLYSDGAGRMIAQRVPRWLSKDAPASNVSALPRARKVR